MKTIIWDLDGTLMDTLQDLMLAVNHALQSNGMPERSLEQTRMAVGNGVRRLMELSVPQGTDNPLFDKVFADFKAYYVQHCQDNSGFYPGIVDTLAELKQRGHRMAVVSNKLQKGVTELYQAQVRTVGTDRFSCMQDFIEVAIGERSDTRRKPAPDMVLKALQEMGLSKEDAVYVGDSDVDIATARNAGLPCISVLWGFRDRHFLEQHGAECFAQQPQDLLKLLKAD